MLLQKTAPSATAPGAAERPHPLSGFWRFGLLRAFVVKIVRRAQT